MKPSIKWALMGSMASLLWLVIEYVVGLHDQYIDYYPIATNFSFIVPIYTYMRTVEDAKLLHSNLDFKKAFTQCLFGVIVYTLLAPVVMFVFLKYVNPEFFPHFIQHATANADKMGFTKERAYQSAMHIYNFPFYMLQNILIVFCSGLIIGAIVSYVQTKKQGGKA